VRTKFWDKVCLGFATLIFGTITFGLSTCAWKLILDLYTHGSLTPWFLWAMGITVLAMTVLFVPIVACVTIIFAGWTFGKDIFKIEGDKYDQVEFNFKEK